MKAYSKGLVSLAAGALLVLSFAPFTYRFIAFLSPALLLWCLLEATRREACLYGFLFGFGFFALGTSWIFISIHTFGEAPFFIAILITLFFIIALSLFVVIMCFLFHLFKTPLAYQCLAIFPSLWVSTEWLRSWLLTGFPWLFLGYSQVDTNLKFFAPFIGVYGLSFLASLIAGALILFIKGNLKQKIIALTSVLLIWSGTQVLSHYSLKPELHKSIPVSLIQGNIPQSLKWNPQQALKTLKLYARLTRSQAPHTLIVWPEAAIPLAASQAQNYLSSIASRLQQNDQILITGLPIDIQGKFYNGILMIGKAKGKYLKSHLVPFGEYYPMKWLLSPLFDYLRIPMSDLSPGPKVQPLLKADGIKLAPFVCYEIAYPQQVLTQARQAEALVTLSDDSWFGESIAAAQHLEIARLRALETQRYLLFSTNSGISAVISSQGYVMEQLGINQQGVLHTQIHPVYKMTPLMRWGYSPMAGLITALLAIAFKLRQRKTRLR